MTLSNAVFKAIRHIYAGILYSRDFFTLLEYKNCVRKISPHLIPCCLFCRRIFVTIILVANLRVVLNKHIPQQLLGSFLSLFLRVYNCTKELPSYFNSCFVIWSYPGNLWNFSFSTPYFTSVPIIRIFPTLIIFVVSGRTCSYSF